MITLVNFIQTLGYFLRLRKELFQRLRNLILDLIGCNPHWDINTLQGISMPTTSRIVNYTTPAVPAWVASAARWVGMPPNDGN